MAYPTNMSGDFKTTQALRNIWLRVENSNPLVKNDIILIL